MFTELHFRADKRAKFNRRRPFDPDAPIDYINEKNKRYNTVVERYYGKYTQDIKQSLERGTAVWSKHPCLIMYPTFLT